MIFAGHLLFFFANSATTIMGRFTDTKGDYNGKQNEHYQQV